MIQTKRTWKLVAVLVAALALAGALLTGCSGNSNSSSANYRTLDQIKDSGKITIRAYSVTRAPSATSTKTATTRATTSSWQTALARTLE